MLNRVALQISILLVCLTFFTALGYFFAPAICPKWENADSAKAYAYGHMQLGLWSEERAQAIMERANRTLQFCKIMGGFVGLSSGVLIILLLRAAQRIAPMS